MELLRQREKEEEEERRRKAAEEKVVMNITANARQLLQKITDRFSTIRRAFRTMDKDKSGR